MQLRWANPPNPIQVYSYWNEKGFLCMMTSKIVNILYALLTCHLSSKTLSEHVLQDDCIHRLLLCVPAAVGGLDRFPFDMSMIHMMMF